MIPDLIFKREWGERQKVWSGVTVKEGRSVVPAAAEAVLFTTTALMVWASREHHHCEQGTVSVQRVQLPSVHDETWIGWPSSPPFLPPPHGRARGIMHSLENIVS